MSNSLKSLPEVTVGTAPVPIDSRPGHYHRYASVKVYSDPANTGTVYIGDSLITGTHYMQALTAGDSFGVAGSAIDASRIYALATVAGQILHIGAS